MTKQLKELITVLLVGAGALYILYGATHTKQLIAGYGTPVKDTDWTAIGIGLGAVVLAVLITFLVKPKKA